MGQITTVVRFKDQRQEEMTKRCAQVRWGPILRVSIFAVLSLCFFLWVFVYIRPMNIIAGPGASSSGIQPAEELPRLSSNATNEEESIINARMSLDDLSVSRMSLLLSGNHTTTTTTFNNKTKKRLKSIILVTVGSRGDIQPLFAVALALREQGYIVRVVTSTAYVADMQHQGLEAIGVYDDPHEIIRSHPKLLQYLNDGNAIKFFLHLKEIFEQQAPQIVPKLLSEVETNRPDLVITSSLGEYSGWAAAKLYGIPYLSIMLYTLSYNPNFMQFGFPKLPFGLHYYILRDGILSVFYYIYLPFDRYLGINLMSTTLRRKQFTNSVLYPVRPIIHLMSPLFKAVLAPNAPPQHFWAGNTVVDPRFYRDSHNSAFAVDNGSTTALETFINAGSKPIYLGWGSMTVNSPQWMTELAVRTAQYANRRAIVLGGGAGLAYHHLVGGNDDDDEMATLRQYARDNVLFVHAAPHEWLFPRVACTVHHGGAGTTIAALRAGVPTVITPIFLDQFDNSYLVRTANVGVGFPNRFANTAWQDVGEAVRKVLTDETIQKNVQEMSKKLLQEDGAREAVLMIEQFWEEWGASGKFFEHFPGPKEEHNNNNNSLAAIVVMIGAIGCGWYFAMIRHKESAAADDGIVHPSNSVEWRKMWILMNNTRPIKS